MRGLLVVSSARGDPLRLDDGHRVNRARSSPSDEIVALALSAPTRRAFRAEVLRRMIDWSGANAGTFQRIYPSFAPLEEAAIEDVDVQIFERTMTTWNTLYAKEMEPVARASIAGGGVALDTRALSHRERSQRAFYADIFAPDKIREALYCSVGAGEAELASIVLYHRSRVAQFSDDTLASVKALLPVIAVADALLPKLERKVETEARLPGLTRPERELLERIGRGYNDAEIAITLGVSLSAARERIASLCSKAGVPDRARLVVEIAPRDSPAPAVVPELRQSLSPRLRAVFDLLHTGASEKEIADRLSLTSHTLHQYVKAVYRVTGVKSRAQLMARALGR